MLEKLKSILNKWKWSSRTSKIIIISSLIAFCLICVGMAHRPEYDAKKEVEKQQKAEEQKKREEQKAEEKKKAEEQKKATPPVTAPQSVPSDFQELEAEVAAENYGKKIHPYGFSYKGCINSNHPDADTWVIVCKAKAKNAFGAEMDETFQATVKLDRTTQQITVAEWSCQHKS